MKPYELYSADDFIEDTDFRDWVQGHSERSSFWLSFLHRYPDKQTAFQQAERFIRAVHVAPEPIGEGQIRKEVERFIEISSTYIPRRGNGSSTFPPRKQKPKSGSRQWRTVVLGASVLFLSVLYWPVLMNRSELAHSQGVDHSITAGLVETTNNTKHLLRVVLTDGSEVMLSPKSGLRYPSRFTQKARIVYLKGEAVFAVKRQTKPFMVYTGEMVTKVLGTRFVVRAFDQDKKVTVQVLSGKVSVYREKSNESITNKKEVKVVALSPLSIATLILILFQYFVNSEWTLTVASVMLAHTAMYSGDFGLLSYFKLNKEKQVVTYDDNENKISYFYGRKDQRNTT